MGQEIPHLKDINELVKAHTEFRISSFLNLDVNFSSYSHHLDFLFCCCSIYQFITLKNKRKRTAQFYIFYIKHVHVQNHTVHL